MQLRTRKEHKRKVSKEGLLLHVDHLDRARLDFQIASKLPKWTGASKRRFSAANVLGQHLDSCFSNARTMCNLTSFNLEVEWIKRSKCERINWTDGLCAIWLLTPNGLRGIVGTRCQESEPPSSLFVSRTGLDDAGLGDLLSVQGLGFFPAPWNLFVGFVVRGRIIGVYYCFSFTQVQLLNLYQSVLSNFPV